MGTFDDEPTRLDLRPDVLDEEAEGRAVFGAPDSAFEATAEFENERTPTTLVCPHCGASELILIKDGTQPPRNAHEAWKNVRCLSTRDRSLWSFCRTDGILREPAAGAETSFDRRRIRRPALDPR